MKATDIMLKDVRDFHKKFKLKALKKPGFRQEDLMEFRIKFITEEFEEFKNGYDADNLEVCFDALIDMVYVILGTAHLMGLPWEDGWDEVQRANMDKVRATKTMFDKRNSDYDVIKPEGWVPPNLKEILERC